MPESPLILYSTNTKLALELNMSHYRGVHFVFCSPYFNPWDFEIDNAQSSNPCELYYNFRAVAKSDDASSALVENNRVGLRAGIASKLREGVISDSTAKKLRRQVREAKPRDFAPRLFVIPYAKVAHLVTEMPLGGRDVRSREYLIKRLPTPLFHVVSLERPNI